MAEAKAVQMLDGRTVNFGARMKRKTEVLEGGLVVRFDFPNGETIEFDSRKCGAETVNLLTGHGGSQKIGDECADLDSVEACVAAVKAMIDRLYNGTAFERIGGGGFQDTTLIEALVNISAASREEVVEAVKAMSSAERLAVRQVPAVKAEIEKIEAAKAKGTDVTGILGKFGL